MTGEEPPPHSGELKHALLQASGPTQSQLSRPMSSGHHVSMEHRLRRRQLNSDTNANNETYPKEKQEKRKKETFFSSEYEEMNNIKKSKKWRNYKKEKKRKKNGRKQKGKEKEKRAQRGTPPPSEIGPKIDFFTQELSREIVTK